MKSKAVVSLVLSVLIFATLACGGLSPKVSAGLTPTPSYEEGIATQYWATDQAVDNSTTAVNADGMLYPEKVWQSIDSGGVAVVQIWTNKSKDYWFPKVDFQIEVIGADGSVIGSEIQTLFVPAGGSNHFQAFVSANGSKPTDVRVSVISVEKLPSSHPVAPISVEWTKFNLSLGLAYRNLSEIEITNTSDFAVDIEAAQTYCLDNDNGALVDASESNHWSERVTIDYGRSQTRQLYGGYGPGFDISNGPHPYSCSFIVYYYDRAGEIGFVSKFGFVTADESSVVSR